LEDRVKEKGETNSACGDVVGKRGRSPSRKDGGGGVVHKKAGEQRKRRWEVRRESVA